MDSNAPNSKKVDVLLQREQTIEQVSHLLLFTAHHAAQHTTLHSTLGFFLVHVEVLAKYLVTLT